MSNVIIQPSGSPDAQKHFRNTIVTPVPFGFLKSFLTPQDLSILANLYGGRPVPTWGVTPGRGGTNVGKWNKMKIGDVAIFTGNNKAFSTGIVTYKTISKALATRIWGFDAAGSTWEYVYFMDEIKTINVPYRVLNELLGYEPNYPFYNFNVIGEPKSENLIIAFGLESKYHESDVTEHEYEEAIKRLSRHDSLDIETNVKARVEQSFLRRILFRNKTVARCGICNREFPVNMMVASHIKKRELCSQEERLDSKNIVMPMCLMGCDSLFENGYISVFDGKVTSLNPLNSMAVSDYIRSIEGNTCNYWTDSSRKYFMSHRDYHKARGL